MTASGVADGPVLPPVAVVPGSLGILGGTFDPVHLGHLVIAEEAREALGLERVLFIPAAVPPHKPGRPVSAAGDRLAMVELAVAGNAAFDVSPMELERVGPSYTVDTLERLAGEGIVDPWFILSAEALAGFDTWHEPDRILDLCRLAVLPRSGHEILDGAWVGTRFPGRESRIRLLPGPLLPISGSVVRSRVAAGRSIRYLVPDAVARYITDHALYTANSMRTPAT